MGVSVGHWVVFSVCRFSQCRQHPKITINRVSFGAKWCTFGAHYVLRLRSKCVKLPAVILRETRVRHLEAYRNFIRYLAKPQESLFAFQTSSRIKQATVSNGGLLDSFFLPGCWWKEFTWGTSLWLISKELKSYSVAILPGALLGKGWWKLSGTPQAYELMSNVWTKEVGLFDLLKSYLCLKFEETAVYASTTVVWEANECVYYYTHSFSTRL